jgi:hypothetical protein
MVGQDRTESDSICSPGAGAAHKEHKEHEQVSVLTRSVFGPGSTQFFDCVLQVYPQVFDRVPVELFHGMRSTKKKLQFTRQFTRLVIFKIKLKYNGFVLFDRRNS